MSPSLLYRSFWATALLFLSTGASICNPTGGVVSSGSASIQGGTGLTTVTQTSHAAIINWQSFSINPGESTLFIQPSAQSAAFNRILGGSASKINGLLSSNGQLYLINQNGILVGPGGVINAAGGFTASTRDISDSDFLNGNLHFIGHDKAGVKNLGQITSLLGNVVLIGKTVSNNGSIVAKTGTTGLVAGDDVLLGQKNADGSTITVNPSPLSKNASGKTGVSNHGTVVSASAELKAANGNIYSMAINNGGTIRATSINRQGGHIWLSSDSGKVSNSGVINASAVTAGGVGGDIQLKSANGSVSHSGKILAKGGTDGTGGNLDISGDKLSLTGQVDLLASGGKAGDFTIDPSTLDVVTTGGVGTISGGANDLTSATINASTVDNYLQSSGNVNLSASNSITVDSLLTWSSANTLTLQTLFFGSTVVINQPITATSGGLTLTLPSNTQLITTGANGNINVGTFTLSSGKWNQVMNPLPGFTASNFVLSGTSNFIRATGGAGTVASPYQIADVYGLQGINSPSNTNLGLAFSLANNIDASATSGWNSGSGFIPIGNSANPFQGQMTGNGFTVSNLTVSSSGTGAGLFGYVGSSGTINSVNVSGTITGNSDVGGLAGANQGNISGSSSSASATGSASVGSLVGYNTGTITSSSATGSASSSSGNYIGGFTGSNYGTITSSYSTASVSAPGATYVGGFSGNNYTAANIQNSSSTGTVSAAGGSEVGGFIGENDSTISNCYSFSPVTGGNEVGGFAGFQTAGTTSTSYAAGTVSGSSSVGGFEGADSNGTINDSYFATDGTGQITGIGSPSGTTIAYNGAGTTAVTGFTEAQMMVQSNFDSAWNFSLGSSGVWGIDGYASTGIINNKLPFLQSQYTVVASVVPNDQTTVYNKTTMGTGFSQTAYTATLAPGVTSFASEVSSGPVLTVSGTSVNVGNSNQILISTVTPSGTGVFEVPPTTATETFSPKPITVTATGGLVTTYGGMPNFGNDAGGSQILAGDILNGFVSYSTTDQFSPGGYLNAGTYTYVPSIVSYNNNYTITGYNAASYTINPATLTYLANPANGRIGFPFGPFSGTVLGFLPGDSSANETTGVPVFSTNASANSAAGFYAINGSGLSSSNYVFAQDPSNATAFNLIGSSVPPPPINLLPGTPNQPGQNNLNLSKLQQLIDGFEDSSNSVNTSFLDQTGSGDGLDTPRFLGGNRHRGERSGSDDLTGDISDIVVDVHGHPVIGFTIRNGYSAFERLGRIPPFIADRLERQLGRDIRDELSGSNVFGPSAHAERELATILDQEGRPGRGFFIRGDRSGFGQKEVPPAIDAMLLNSLSPEVRDELATAVSDITGTGANTSSGVTDQNGQPAVGFYTRGGYSSFSHGVVPPAIASRLGLGLNREVRDALYEAYLAAHSGGTDNSTGAGGGQAVVTVVVDQKGNHVPGFMAPAGGYFGFNGAPLPPAVLTKMLHGLNADVRNQLSNAGK